MVEKGMITKEDVTVFVFSKLIESNGVLCTQAPFRRKKKRNWLFKLSLKKEKLD